MAQGLRTPGMTEGRRREWMSGARGSTMKASWCPFTPLTKACMECARAAGYVRLALEAAAENKGALSLYQKAGFVEYGRNPKGFRSKTAGFQELIYMRLEW